MSYPNQPPPPYPPPPYQPSAPYVASYTTQPTMAPTAIIVPVGLGPFPQSMTCPSCHACICTDVKTESNVATHVSALLCCLLLFPFCFVPYLLDCCKSHNHYCPNCGAYLGTSAL